MNTAIPYNIEKLLMKVQKPSRYAGGEMGSIIKDKNTVDVRFAFCFPDLYEVGMSHFGIKILYSVLNRREYIWCERVFSPDRDFENLLRQTDTELYALESFDGLSKFDFVGFTLQYEMCYTTVLNMLQLGNIPYIAQQRIDQDWKYPLVVGGGPCSCNPEPIADFFDIFSLGDGEEALVELCDIYRDFRKRGLSRKQFLEKIATIDGFYVPSMYNVSYNDDGTFKDIEPIGTALPRINKRTIMNLSKAEFPDSFVVPFSETVHDRAMVEVLRGCYRGCRFCQAGYIYRPYREKSADVVSKQAKCLCENTGYDEVSLLSLSTSDHSELEDIMENILSWSEPKKINVSLPSLRVDGFSPKLMELLSRVRKSGLTFAPEAGSQRMRDVINKNVTEKELMDTCKIAFMGGATSVKLYFMLGLPTETDEDIVAINELANKVVELFYSIKDKSKARAVEVTVSCSVFVPKPFTPFQYDAQCTLEELRHKQSVLLSSKKSKRVTIKYHESKTAIIEAVLARGDRRLCNVVEKVFLDGGTLEAWETGFSFERWENAMQQCGLDIAFYAQRKRDYDEKFPWDHIQHGVTKRYLISERKKAMDALTTGSQNARLGKE